MLSRGVAILALLSLLPLDASPAAEPEVPVWTKAAPGYEWSFPRDYWCHRDYALEWWYLTGHLQARNEDGTVRRFGYQYTIFRIGLSPDTLELDSAWNGSHLVMGHAALTDKDVGDHRFSELLYRESPLLATFNDFPQQPIVRTRGPVGTAGEWALHHNGEGFDFNAVDVRAGFAFELSTRPTKSRVFQGPGGLSRKSTTAEVGSHYYSFTRLQTEGLLTLDGTTWTVEGESWMDMEFSSGQLAQEQVGWDWFSLQFDDGTELMMFSLRRADGTTDYRFATRIGRDGGASYLGDGAWSLDVVDRWRSGESGIEYPSGWSLKLAGEDLRFVMKPEVADQENRARLGGGPTYWEGAVRVVDDAGRTVGRGFVELTGYGTDNRPPM